MAFVSQLACIYLALIPHDDEVTLRRRKWKQRKKNPRSLMVTWALVFLTKPLL
uniref:Uncharacterized protein n=1 Tax=Gorilla gorilla gorilla TaxID=9595 RepID=A0A2I2ZIC8_GORGO